MNLRKCQALNTTGDNPIEFEGHFHGWHVVEGEKFCLIEDASGNMRVWDTNIQFLEPARQRVEVTVKDQPPKTALLVQWYQYNNGYVSGPAALVLHDDGKHQIYDETQVRIIKEEENE